MYKKIQQAAGYFLHFLRAKGSRGHGVHSPFVFDFITTVLNEADQDKRQFAPIEHFRRQWCNRNDMIQVQDLGAGSLVDNRAERSIGSIVKNAAKSPRFGRLFYRMIKHYHIDSVLELGTSLGLTTQYFSLANPPAGVVTIEGSPAIAAFADAGFSAAGLSNIVCITGDFAEKLPSALNGLKGRKLLFFDGNHQYAPTLDYFQQALTVAEQDDIFIFDDIHWSAAMESAWAAIKKNQKVTCSLDLFFIGIVFFKKEFKEKLDFSIRF